MKFLHDAIKAYSDKNPLRLHMPGHKGQGFSDAFYSSVLPYDLTELSVTDNLYVPEGVIARAQSKAAEIFGASATCFSAGGATLCVQAALALTSADKKLAVDMNCHKSVVNTMALLDITPVWYTDDWHEALRQGVSAMFITSPSYYGMARDIPKAVKSCRAAGIPLIVDNSHGTHFIAIESLMDGVLHPIKCGADLVIDSAHKTLPVLTGGAMLHSGGKYSDKEIAGAMSVFGSTSPSYLIMASIDYGVDWINNNKEIYINLAGWCSEVKEQIVSLGGTVLNNTDKCRLVISFAPQITGIKLAKRLESEDIFCEMSDKKWIVMLPGLYFSEYEKQKIIKCLRDFIGNNAEAALNENEVVIDKSTRNMKMSLREALFSDKIEVYIDNAIGGVCAEIVAPYPPGIPIAVPGQLITQELASVLKYYNTNYIFQVKS